MLSLKEVSDIVKSNLAVAAASAITYKNNWSSDFVAKNLADTRDMLKAYFTPETISTQRLTSATKFELIEAGFQQFGEPDTDGEVLMLIPLYLHFVLPDDLPVYPLSTTTGNKTPTSLSRADKDHRGGMLAYGLLV